MAITKEFLIDWYKSKKPIQELVLLILAEKGVNREDAIINFTRLDLAGPGNGSILMNSIIEDTIERLGCIDIHDKDGNFIGLA